MTRNVRFQLESGQRGVHSWAEMETHAGSMAARAAVCAQTRSWLALTVLQHVWPFIRESALPSQALSKRHGGRSATAMLMHQTLVHTYSPGTIAIAAAVVWLCRVRPKACFCFVSTTLQAFAFLVQIRRIYFLDEDQEGLGSGRDVVNTTVWECCVMSVGLTSRTCNQLGPFPASCLSASPCFCYSLPKTTD